MIDFRYHLVSIIAVFLALAIGIVVGADALKPLVVQTLDRASKREAAQVQSLLGDKRKLQQQISSDQKFAQAGAGALLSGLLSGQRVVLVTAPGASSQAVSGVTTAVQEAGGTMTARVSMQPSFFDAAAVTETSLRSLSQELAARNGLTVDTASLTGNPQISGQQAAAGLIANALAGGGSLPWTAGQSSSILAGFGQQGYLKVSGGQGSGGTAVAAPASLAIVITPGTAPASDSDPENLALIALAQQLQTASQGTVVAGSLTSSGSGSAISEIRGSGAPLTTVDSANLPVGQVAVALALKQLLLGKSPASYGVGPNAYPTPSPTATPSVAPSQPGGGKGSSPPAKP
ncbi:MAG TPA: copper transporter [Streptosporangiaceae bacterium]